MTLTAKAGTVVYHETAHRVRLGVRVPSNVEAIELDMLTDELGGGYTNTGDEVQLVKLGLVDMGLEPAALRAKMAIVEAFLAAALEYNRRWSAAGADPEKLRQVVTDSAEVYDPAEAAYMKVRSEAEAHYAPLARALRINRHRATWRGLAAARLLLAVLAVPDAEAEAKPGMVAAHRVIWQASALAPRAPDEIIDQVPATALVGLADFVDRLLAPSSAQVGNSGSSSGSPSGQTTQDT